MKSFLRRTFVHRLSGLILWGFLAVVIFPVLLSSTKVLFSTDNNIGANGYFDTLLPYGWSSYWYDTGLVGSPGGLFPVNWTFVLLYLLPVRIFTNWIHAVDLFVASVFITLFLRERKVGQVASLLSGLVFAWLGSNLTLTYAGHTTKFGTVAFAAVTLFCIQKCVKTGQHRWGILAGGAFGIMLLEQQDLALFFGIFVGAYAIFAYVREKGFRTLPMVGYLLPIGLIALLLAGSTGLRVYLSNRGSASANEASDPNEKWEFTTQWSVPPDETIDMVAPGYTGWRSGEPEGPYWGRTGRSAGWEQTHQGFMNFRLESIYIGAIPVVLALFAVVAAFGGGVQGSGFRVQGSEGKGEANEENAIPTLPHSRTPILPILQPDRRAEILFWGAVALITLLLAYGKYFSLYALFYKLPVVNNIRNPNKFLQVFQMALGILAAYGLDMAAKWRGGRLTINRRPCG